jgi:hypothetical protein
MRPPIPRISAMDAYHRPHVSPMTMAVHSAMPMVRQRKNQYLRVCFLRDSIGMIGTMYGPPMVHPFVLSFSTSGQFILSILFFKKSLDSSFVILHHPPFGSDTSMSLLPNGRLGYRHRT